MNNHSNIVNKINKTGGVISDPSDAFDAHTERPSAPVFVRKAALFVSALWCLLPLPLTFASCTEAIPFNTSQNPDTDTDTRTDSTGSFTGEILDWEDGKSEPLIPAKEEKGGTL
ncbi:MAG: hypothetical protein IJX44_03720 [Bacteroidaceae bacterium]|nr:hypothetical protein [Bacteroidaceae bacterium]